MATKPTKGTGNHHALQLLTCLAQHGRAMLPLLILTHDFPDPDALASAAS